MHFSLSNNRFSLKYLLFMLVMLLPAGCSYLQSSEYYYLNNREGLVFFSLTSSGDLAENIQLEFINEQTRKPISVSVKLQDALDIGQRLNKKTKYRYDQAIGKLIVLRLPEGVYQLQSWHSDDRHAASGGVSQRPEKKFRVMNARALYLGNLHLVNENKESLLTIRDNRLRDFPLFFERYSQVESEKTLVASQLFLNPGLYRDRVFDAYLNCLPDDYQLISKKRLPQAVKPFRTLRIGSEEKKISRIDGYRLKFRQFDGPITLSMKVELSDNRQFDKDKEVLNEWVDDVKKNIKTFNVSTVDGRYFSEYQLETNVLDEKRMIYMSVLQDPFLQMITTFSFINPPEFLRPYKTVEEFMPKVRSIVSTYQHCVLQRLNKTK